MKVNDVKYISKKIMESGEIPLIWGHFGVGKTDIAREIAEESNRELIILVISQMEPGDLIGLPSRKDERTSFLKPDWWPEKGNTLIVIDEINRAHRSIRNAIMQLLIDKRIHNHILPEDCWVMAAANPPDEEYDQVDLITDPAFMSRFFHLEMNSEVNEWINWSRKNKVPEIINEFLLDYPEFLAPDKTISMRLELRPSPRSWYKLGNVLKNLSEEEIDKFGYLLAAGILGPEGARMFQSKLEGTTLINNPEEIMYNLSSEMLNRISDYTISEVSSTILRLNQYFSKLNEENSVKLQENINLVSENLLRFKDVVPKDSFFSLIRHLVYQIDNEKGIVKSVLENLIEELAMDTSIFKYLEKRENIE